uniref:O-methyltransferase n=1 Tax=Brachyspira catarrhinii TaxID=2528966 RepID=UPI003F4C4FCC
MNKYKDFFKNIENYDSYLLDDINIYLTDKSQTLNSPYGVAQASEMSNMERRFLNGIIRKNKPKKILELGVSAGGSSAIILNAIKDIDDSHLYSIDYSDKYYRNTSKEVGWLVKENLSRLSNKWTLYTNGVAAKFMEQIGGDIDICLLDTMHQNPGEFIDFLMILPYMKKNGIIILHDTLIHTWANYAYTNGTLFSAIKGEKYTINEGKFKNVSNIGAVVIDENIMKTVFDYFFLITLPWTYIPTYEDIIDIRNLFSIHYDKHLVELFSSTSSYYYDIFKRNEVRNEVRNEITNIDNKLNKLIDSIAWWIPIKKLRNNFRNKILQSRAEQSRAEQSRAEQSSNM